MDSAKFSSSTRILSVDIYRGLTMLVMIFVNDVGGVKDLPWWTYHMPPGANGMTYVDWVFPGFLFAVGLSIPLALNRRFEQGGSAARVWVHIVTRSLALSLLGLVLANASKLDPNLSGIDHGAWSLLALLGTFLTWGAYPVYSKYPRLRRILQYSGLALIAIMLIVFRRRTDDGRVAWLDFSYWEILGLIGFTYLSVCILYIPFRKKPWAALTLFVVLSALNIFSTAGWLSFLQRIPIYVWPFETGGLASIVMAGIVASLISLDATRSWNAGERAARGLAFTFLLFAAGWLLSPLGISKLGGTPSWCLYCAGISHLIFLVLHWLVDIGRRSGWAAFVKPAGSNTLLTYLLPDVFYAADGYRWMPDHLSRGLPGAARSLLFTALILGCSGVLTRMKLRLQL